MQIEKVIGAKSITPTVKKILNIINTSDNLTSVKDFPKFTTKGGKPLNVEYFKNDKNKGIVSFVTKVDLPTRSINTEYSYNTKTKNLTRLNVREFSESGMIIHKERLLSVNTPPNSFLCLGYEGTANLPKNAYAFNTRKTFGYDVAKAVVDCIRKGVEYIA